MELDQVVVDKINNYEPLTAVEAIAASYSDDLELVVAASRQPTLSVEHLRRLAGVKVGDYEIDELFGPTETDLMYSVASNPNTPLDLLEELSKSEDFEVRNGVAQNKAAPVELLELLTFDSKSPVVASVILNHSAPVSFLSDPRLVHSPMIPVRGAIARHEDTPRDTLIELLEDREPYVRGSAVLNPNFTNDDLWMIGKSNNYALALPLSTRPDLDEDLYRLLASMGEKGVYVILGTNPSTPVDLLRMLAGMNSGSINSGLSTNPSLPNDIVAKLAQSEEPWLRAKISSRENLDPALLEELSMDEDASVRETVAWNWKVPDHVLRVLLQDGSNDVRKWAKDALHRKAMHGDKDSALWSKET